MKVLSGPLARPILVYVTIVIAVTSSIWCVKYFAPQDGSAHVYNAFLMSELVKGDPQIRANLSLNTLTVPNSTGHWILTLLLQIFSPFTCLKLMSAGTYAGFVAAIMWLRYSTAGEEGLSTSALVGAVLGLNWFWFGGFYNFIIGVTAFIVLIALIVRWQSKMNFLRMAAISLILVAIYLSHVVSFAMAAGSFFVLVLWSESADRKRNLFYFTLAVLPSIALALIFRATTASAEELHPVWRWWSDSTSMFAIVRGFLADPFVLISRETFPFTSARSRAFAIFMPGLWTVLSLILLTVTFLLSWKDRQSIGRRSLPFIFLLAMSVLGALIAPDDFGLSNGGILRERVLLCALCFSVPLFQVGRHLSLKRLAHVGMTYVIVFQSMAMWDYALTTSPIVEEFSLARSAIADNDTIASIEIIEDGYRFHSVPESQLGLLASVGKRTAVMDNYEIGHYLFPVVTNSLSDRQFVRQVAISHAFVANGPKKEFDETLTRLDQLLDGNRERFTKVILWRRDARVENILYKWFDPMPILERGRVRVLRRR